MFQRQSRQPIQHINTNSPNRAIIYIETFQRQKLINIFSIFKTKNYNL